MAVRLRLAFIELGVTFIKLGQFLSIRRDIVPFDLACELALLQDQVPPFSYEEAKSIIENQLGCDLNQCFIVFEQEPIASASIGQVHRAVLKGGQVVAVKVQRANLVEIVNQDLALMHLILNLTRIVQPKMDWRSWSCLIDEFGKTLFTEMDYLEEGRSADRLRKILRPFPMIIIPKIFWHYTTKHVLTEEFCQGIKIDKFTVLENLDAKRLARCLVEAYSVQVLQHGYFHADPHAGNLAISASGQLIIYDFGMMGYLTTKQRIWLCRLIDSIVQDNIGLFIESLSNMGLINTNSIEETDRLQNLIEPIWIQYRSGSGNQKELFELEKEIDILLLNKYFQLPANLAYLIRMIVALEEIVRRLDPNLNFLRATGPYFKKIRVN